MTNDSLPLVVLCHPACSGGSVIFRELIRKFGFLGISEVCHHRFLDDLPSMLDPESQLVYQGELSPAEFGEVFIGRIENCIGIAQAKQRPLLVREHSHSYFFGDFSNTQSLKTGSWIADQFERKDQDVKCLVSVRNPIDCWLAFRSSFPFESPFNFDDYCKKYLEFVTAAKSSESTLLFKYEDLLSNPERLFVQIREFTGISIAVDTDVQNATAYSTGNSGRQSQQLEFRKRRPYSLSFARRHVDCDSYRELIEELDYPIFDSSLRLWWSALNLPSTIVDFTNRQFLRLQIFGQNTKRWFDRRRGSLK